MGSLTSLARLATESGGRFTEGSNDLTLGYARAQRDLGCVYTVGFYDKADDDVPRPVTVRVKRNGVQAVHPSAYLFRSVEEKRTSLLKAAFHAPSVFDNGVVRAHVFPLRPTHQKQWDGLLAVSFPIPFAGGGEAETREFGAVLTKGSKESHKFSRAVTLVPKRDDLQSAPLVTFVEQVKLTPGAYQLTVVMSDPDSPLPHSTAITLEVPELPRRELTVLQPILGSRAGSELLLIADADSGLPERDRIGGVGSFRPLMLQQIDEPTDIVALNRICRIGKKTRFEQDAVVSRVFKSADGEEIAQAPPVELELDPKSKVACQDLVDVVPAAVLPDGEYVFEAWVVSERQAKQVPRNETRFAVTSQVSK